MSERRFGAIIQIGDILVSEDVIDEYFACDYAACKGRCCIEGDSGAPVEEDELASLLEAYPECHQYMSEEGCEVVENEGVATIDREGDLVTTLVGNGGACSFCSFGENGSVLCAIERAGLRKPASCSLYPIRVTKLSSGGQALNLHRWNICKDAFRKGRKENIPVYRFLKKPLIAVYGKEFYEALDAAAKHLKNAGSE